MVTKGSGDEGEVVRKGGGDDGEVDHIREVVTITQW